jgi:hypothetical protein
VNAKLRIKIQVSHREVPGTRPQTVKVGSSALASAGLTELRKRTAAVLSG